MLEFLTVMILTLGLGLILSGLFTAYFGRGKSRKVGISLTVLGLLMAVLVVMAYRFELAGISGDDKILDIVWDALRVIIAFGVGAVIALGIFLVAIMKT